jgi:hypothetical protein
MGIISHSRSNPAMLRAIARYCTYRGITTAPEDVLQGALVPQGLTSRQSDDTPTSSEGTVWRDTIELMLELGIAERRDGELSFRDDTLSDLAAEETSPFRRALRSIILSPEHNTGLWDHAKGEPWPSTAAREFSRIAAWLLETQVGELSGDAEEIVRRARRSVDGPSKLVENAEQWRVFRRWADALGLTSRIGAFQLPDPTVAIEEELPGVFRSKVELPALKVREGLVGAIPILRNGAYSNGLDHFLANKPRRLAAEAGPALAFALVRLERKRVIHFDRRSDADQLVLSDPHSTDNPTHIAWRGAT